MSHIPALNQSDQYVNMMKEKYLATACFTVISLLYILYAVHCFFQFKCMMIIN